MEIKEYNKKSLDLVSNNKYFEWLRDFTEDKNGFSDQDWLYFPEELSKSDRDNVGKLSLFYDCVEDYANQYHISPIKCEFGKFYTIKLDDCGLQIGILEGQGVETFCQKIQIEKDNDFIDFNDIINSYKERIANKSNTSGLLCKSDWKEVLNTQQTYVDYLKKLVRENPEEATRIATKNLRKRYNKNSHLR